MSTLNSKAFRYVSRHRTFLFFLVVLLAQPAGAGAEWWQPQDLSRFTLTKSPAIRADPTPPAQDPDKGEWSNVVALVPGTRVQIRGLTKKDKADGRVVSASADSLTIASKNGELTFNRGDTTKVQKINPRKTLWYSLGGGAMAGAALLAVRSTSANRPLGIYGAGESTRNGFLLAGATLGAGAPFMYLSRDLTVYERR